MTDSDPIDPSRIDHHLERVLSDTDEEVVPLVHDALDESSDRWYGQLLLNVYSSLPDGRKPETTLPAAAGIELLRGYVHLRCQLLVQLTDFHAHSLTLEPTSALLAGDYLYSAAFSSLRSVPGCPTDDCFEILTTVLQTITKRFARTFTPPTSTDYDRFVFLDETVGRLGDGAAALGATLAGINEQNRRHLARFGRGLSTTRQITHVLDSNQNEAMVVPPTLDETRFRLHAERERDEANRALDALPKTVDVPRLRSLVEATESRRD